MRIIKKYSNRRMYDTKDSKPITIQDIGNLVVKGEDIQVIDYETGEDITTIVLIQVILEQQRDIDGLAPAPMLLKELIRRGRKSVQDLVENSLFNAIQSISLTEEKAAQIVEQLLQKKKITLSQAEFVQKRLKEMIVKSQETLEFHIKSAIKNIMMEMNIPTHKEIDNIQKNIEKLNNTIEKLLAIYEKPHT